MIRITQQSQQNSTIDAIKRNFSELEMSQRRMSTGERIQYPHQNVSGTVNSIYYRTRISAVDRFQENIIDGKERLNVVHDSLGSLSDAVNRAREIAVMGANGVYTKEDRARMAVEVEEMIERAYEVSLAKSKGEFVFSGTSSKTEPFKIFYTQNEELGRSVISGVNYEGDSNSLQRQVETKQYIDVSAPGNQSFWATNSSIMSVRDLSNYTANRDQKIMLDNTAIEIKEGDNLEAIVSRINSSGSDVKASIGELSNNEKIIQLTSNRPHKIMLQDLEGGTVFQDLGLIREGLANYPENNYEPTAVVNGKSVFEAMMFLRDALVSDDIANVGGAALGYIDSALDNILTTQAEVSAKVTRLDQSYRGLDNIKFAATEALSKNEDIDFSEEVVNFNMWQFAHNASLQTAGRLLGRTLLDYLR